MTDLNEREREVLRELAAFGRQAEKGKDWSHPQWAQPMDVGGRDGSHHSYTLTKLSKLDPPLVEKAVRSPGHRGSYKYRITEAGKAAIREVP